MADTIKQLKIFFGSPSGLDKFRVKVREEVDTFNETESESRGVRFKIIGWEDIPTGIGNLQKQIDPYLCNCDYYMLLLHNKWGSPPDKSDLRFSSGSEKEFHLAYTCCTQEKYFMKDIIVFFRQIRTKDKIKGQTKKVKDFEAKLIEAQKLGYKKFKTYKEFIKKFRLYLSKWLRDNENNDNILNDLKPPESVLDFFSGE